MTGLTTWWAKDSAWWRRERVVALGVEFGAEGPAVLDWLTCEADAQRDAGRLKAGYRTIAHGAFVDIVRVRPIVSAAVRLGLLDEFESVDGPAGDVFTCRVSGWKQDQDRIHDRMRKRDQRAASAASNGESPANGHNPEQDEPGPSRTCPELSGDVPGSHVNPTPPLKKRTTSSSPDAPETADPDVLRLSRLLADLIVQRDPKASPQPDSARWLQAMRLLIADRDGDIAEVEQVLRWSQADPFWQANILSPTKLRHQFTQLAIKGRSGSDRRPLDPDAKDRRARRGAALENLMTPGGVT